MPHHATNVTSHPKGTTKFLGRGYGEELRHGPNAADNRGVEKIFQLLPGIPKGQMGLDASDDLFELKGFGDVIHSPGRESLDFIFRLIEGAEKDHRYLPKYGIFLKFFANLVPVHTGHVDIQENKIRSISLRRLESELSLGEGIDMISLFPEHVSQELQVLGSVIHDHDFLLLFYIRHISSSSRNTRRILS